MRKEKSFSLRLLTKIYDFFSPMTDVQMKAEEEKKL
jgi:hypothetical protein